MTKPDDIDDDIIAVTFSGDSFHDTMVRFLNWLEELHIVRFQRPDGSIGEATHTNDFYVLHDTLHISHDSEMGGFHIEIECDKGILND